VSKIRDQVGSNCRALQRDREREEQWKEQKQRDKDEQNIDGCRFRPFDNN
jgi:hypothetical protein